MSIASIVESARIASPVPAPQAPAVLDGTLWVSSMREPRVVALDAAGAIVEERAVPGTAWGLSAHRGALIANCGLGEADDRTIFRADATGAFVRWFDCPEFTGSFLASDDTDVFVGQWYNERVLRFDNAGTLVRSYAMPRQVCGIVVAEGALFAVTVTDEKTDAYTLARVDLTSGEATDLARIPFKARGLAKHGMTFVTNHRERDEIVRFTLSA